MKNVCVVIVCVMTLVGIGQLAQAQTYYYVVPNYQTSQPQAQYISPALLQQYLQQQALAAQNVRIDPRRQFWPQEMRTMNLQSPTKPAGVPIYEVKGRGIVALWSGIWFKTGNCWKISSLNKQWLLSHDHKLIGRSQCLNVCGRGPMCLSSPTAAAAEGICDKLCTGRSIGVGNLTEKLFKTSCGCR